MAHDMESMVTISTLLTQKLSSNSTAPKGGKVDKTTPMRKKTHTSEHLVISLYSTVVNNEHCDMGQ